MEDNIWRKNQQVKYESNISILNMFRLGWYDLEYPNITKLLSSNSKLYSTQIYNGPMSI